MAGLPTIQVTVKLIHFRGLMPASSSISSAHAQRQSHPNVYRAHMHHRRPRISFGLLR